MTDTTAKLFDLYRDASSRADEIRRRGDETMFAVVAGETVTVLGRRAKFTVEWVDEPPWGSAEVAQERVAEALVKMRSRP